MFSTSNLDLNVKQFHNSLMNPIFRLVGFGVFILVAIVGLAYSMFGVNSLWFWGSIVFCGLAILWAVLRYRNLYRIVECSNCHRRMTYKQFRDAGGCPKCGTDLYIRSSKRI